MEIVCIVLLCLSFGMASVSAWKIETVDSNPLGSYQGGTAIALDSSGDPNIAFVHWNNKSIRYATKSGESWLVMPVSSPTYAYPDPSLKIGINGIPQLVYYDVVNFGNPAIVYAILQMGTWSKQKIDKSSMPSSSGASHALALDSYDRPHVVYTGYNDYSLKYAWFDNAEGKWKNETVDPYANMGPFSSAAIDSSNHLHVAYISKDQRSLEYYYYDGLTWTNTTVYNGGNSYAVGSYCSIDVDGSGKPHIAFAKNYNELNYARFDGTQWIIVRVPGQYAADVSIDVTEAGLPSIAFTDHGNGTNAELKYTWYDGQQWRVQVIDTDGDTGHGSKLAVDSAGAAHIVYYDDSPVTVHRLLYAVNHAPILNSIGSKEVNLGNTISISLTATDAEGDPLTYSTSTLPSGATLTGSTFSWTPGAGQVGNFPVTITVSDGIFIDSEMITITVNSAPTPVPTVTGITPATGPLAGGTSIIITGTGFTGATAVNFGSTPATSYTVNNATQITAISPAGTGTVDIRVTSSGGTSETGSVDQFTYAPPLPPGQTPCTSCMVINNPGVYVLQNDILNSTATKCIDIRSSDVTFDGNGHTIDGIGTTFSTGIYAMMYPQMIRVTIKNVTVTDWSSGIDTSYAITEVLNSNALRNSESGISIWNAPDGTHQGKQSNQ